MTTEEKALFFTNASYLMADIVHSFLLDAECELGKMRKQYNQADKMRINKAIKAVKDAKRLAREAIAPVYGLKDVDDACDDSDFLYEAIKLVINRTDDTEESKNAMLEHIRKLPKVEHKKV